MDEYRSILYDVAPTGIATVTLNRPERMNSMGDGLTDELYECLKVAADDRGVRVLILTGAGKAFCPGADLNGVGSATRQYAARPTSNFQVSALLHNMHAVTIAAINGACAGAGLALACACDFRLAARAAVLRTAFLNVAVAGDFGMPWSLPRLVGPQKARELMFFPDKFSAEEAERIGLVARVWDDAVFREEVAAFAGRLAAAAPLALPVIKQHMVMAERMDFSDFLGMEGPKITPFFATEDSGEARRAFFERRDPVFKGS